MVFSAMILGLKGGLTIGSSLVAGILALYNYDASLAVQPAETIRGIFMAVSIYASIPFFTAVACLFFYPINKPMELQIERDLAERRKNAGL
jgi:GPH family glycoside/pentoside/hexuronide:cation symporter